MTKASPDIPDLGWHAEWLRAHAQLRAGETYLAMLGLRDLVARDENGLLFWERAGLALAGEVHFGMDGIEEPAFVERAQLAALVIYLRRLHQLARTSPMGGRA